MKSLLEESTKDIDIDLQSLSLNLDSFKSSKILDKTKEEVKSKPNKAPGFRFLEKKRQFTPIDNEDILLNHIIGNEKTKKLINSDETKSDTIDMKQIRS